MLYKIRSVSKLKHYFHFIYIESKSNSQSFKYHFLKKTAIEL